MCTRAGETPIPRGTTTFRYPTRDVISRQPHARPPRPHPPRHLITPAHHPNLTSSTPTSTTIQRRSTKAAEVWDLEAEAARLNLVLDDLPMEEKAWDRAVNVAYRKAALRAHPDKHPPDQRDAAEANFKRLNRANKLLLRVGKAIRDEAESGDGESIFLLSYDRAIRLTDIMFYSQPTRRLKNPSASKRRNGGGKRRGWRRS